ncbi:hypothetical protein BU23DRAFT_630494 [Bimuria novae-zelandiae CBS 107.79]|uniref:Uncharacterized protein n=1 Tax=Bimuria novae-zelandiae CBS 107.79 TaxID=1447943 RepID=A0A6A5UUM2_9PLEO|nr:hypothetical protein BU23DRAFT_630494 [Bimuria novae-zelandiae CBS 107.79]
METPNESQPTSRPFNWCSRWACCQSSSPIRFQAPSSRMVCQAEMYEHRVNVAAVGRLYATAVQDYPGDVTKPFDTTYKLWEAFLWIMGEATGLYLVFSVPAFPKILTGSGIISQAIALFHSGARLSQPSTSRHSNHGAWPPTIGSAPIKPRRGALGYRLGEDGKDTQDSQVELTNFRDDYQNPTDRPHLDIDGHFILPGTQVAISAYSPSTMLNTSPSLSAFAQNDGCLRTALPWKQTKIRSFLLR